MAVSLHELPQNVRDWLFSEQLMKLESGIKDFLHPAELDAVNALEMQVFTRDISVPEFVTKLTALIPGPRGVEIAKNLLASSLQPIAFWFADDVVAELTKLGGNLNEYRDLLDGDEAVSDALRGVNVELIPPRSKEAITGKMLEFLNGTLEKAALLEAMMKSPKIGGWGWSQDTAVPVIEQLEKHIQEAAAKQAVFVGKAQFAAIEAKRADAKRMLAEEMGSRQQDIPATPTAIAEPSTVAPALSVSVDADPVPDPFAFIVSQNLPHLADSELSIAQMPDPFQELLKELERKDVQLGAPPVPQPEFAFANVTEHRGVAESAADAPKTAFEKALHASDILLEHELREIEHQKDELMKSVPETAIVVSTTLEALVDRIIADSKFTSSDTSLVRRIRNIVSSRLRDIRGSEETARLITKIGAGSRDLSREMVEKIVMLSEQAFLEFQRKVIERTLQRERSRRVREREEVLEQKREDAFKTEQELNARFQKLTGKDMPLELSVAQTQGALSAGNEPRVEQVAVAAKAPERKVNVTLSPASVAPKPPQANADLVGDVKYVRQLAGPVEELRTMRLTDFRRLSKEPKLATEKLMAKLELLAADGYDKKVQGLVAWRESPVMKLYLAVTKEALDQAMPITAVLEKKRKEIPEMLTLEECQAIRELNAKLRY